MHSLKWIDELLRRSDPALLDFGNHVQHIDLSDRHDGGLSVLELVLNHTSRLRIFSLKTTALSWEFLRSHFLQQPAPNLEFLNYTCSFSSERVLTDPLFNDHAPSLRNLHLRRCAVDFSSPVLRPLTELYVNHRDMVGLNATPTVVRWLHVLKEMPSLRWITFIDAISDASDNQIILPTIHLVKLEMLRVHGVFHKTITFINQLIMPPRCGLRLDCRDAHPGLDQQILWALVERKLSFWEKDTPNRHFAAKHEGRSIIIGNMEAIDAVWRVSAAEVEYYSCWESLPVDPVLTIMLHSWNPADVTSHFLSLFALFECIFVTTTHLKLWIDYDKAGISPDVFRPLIDRFSFFVDLQSLDLMQDSHSFFFPFLQHMPPSSSVLFPALHTLHFFQCHFRRDSGSLAQVAAFIRWRREQGFPVHNVSIKESYVDRKFVLSQLGDVEVDMGDGWNDSDPDSD
jgi:hypothetical protein